MYKKLIEYYKAGKISFKYVKTFNMDEYVDLPRDHPESYHFYMYNNFFKHIDIDPKNVHILDGNAPDLKFECDEFERKIKEAGGVELFIGGTLKFYLLINFSILSEIEKILNIKRKNEHFDSFKNLYFRYWS